MGQPDAVALLVAKDEIREALARYCRGADRGEDAMVRSAYHEDAVDDHGYPSTAEDARDDNPGGAPAEWTSSTHFIGNVLIEVDLPAGTATSETYFIATMRSAHEGVAWELAVNGRYADRWERRADGPFLIADRMVILDAVSTNPMAGMWPGPDTDVPKLFWGAPPLPDSEVTWGQRSLDDYTYGLLSRAD